jgi:hypothetical protein
MVDRHSGECMGIGVESTQNGASVVQWECNGHDDQKWPAQVR